MSHEIAKTADGRDAIAYAGQVPWHGLGQSTEPDAPLEDWIEASGTGFEIKEAPVQFIVPPAGETELDENGDGDIKPFPGRKVLYRADTGHPLSVMSEGYKVVQPREVMEFFRDLVAGAGFRMETAGVLFGGAQYWGLARVLDDTAILDDADRVGGFLLLSTSCDGSRATRAQWTTVRVVCNNTLSVAVGDRAHFSINHSRSFDHAEAKAALGLAGSEAREAFASSMDTLRALARCRLDTQSMLVMTMRLFGVAPGPDVDVERLKKVQTSEAFLNICRASVDGQGLLGAGLEGGLGTAWGWLNAVTQHADHGSTYRKGEFAADRRMQRTMFGEGEALKNRAMAIALDAAGLRAEDGDPA